MKANTSECKEGDMELFLDGHLLFVCVSHGTW